MKTNRSGQRRSFRSKPYQVCCPNKLFSMSSSSINLALQSLTRYTCWSLISKLLKKSQKLQTIKRFWKQSKWQKNNSKKKISQDINLNRMILLIKSKHTCSHKSSKAQENNLKNHVKLALIFFLHNKKARNWKTRIQKIRFL